METVRLRPSLRSGTRRTPLLIAAAFNLVALCIPLLVTNEADAFSTPNHEIITADGILPVDPRLTTGAALIPIIDATDAPDFVDGVVSLVHGSGLYDVAQDSPHHFDNSAFQAGLSYVNGLWNQIQSTFSQIEELSSSIIINASAIIADELSAFVNFGFILHADQDFYSHSDYVEMQLYAAADCSVGSFIGSAPAVPCGSLNFQSADDVPLWNRDPNFSLDGNTLISGTFPDSTSCDPVCHQTLNKDSSSSSEGQTLAAAYLGNYCLELFSDEQIALPVGLQFTIPAQNPIAGNTDQAVACESLTNPPIYFSDSMFDVAKDLAIRQTSADFQEFESLSGGDPFTGLDLINDSLNDPALISALQNLTNSLDPSDLNSWQRLAALGNPPTPAPEPSSILLMLSGIVGLGLMLRRRGHGLQ